ncbi:MAG TPA: phosphoglycerate dehydrogenase [Capillimicrobium sp.]
MSVVLVTPRSFRAGDPAVLERLESAVDEVRFNDLGRPLTAAELRERLDGVDALLAGLDEIDASVFDAAPQLRVVARYGSGYDRVDLRAAARHGVVVTATPGANASAVAEWTVTLMLALCRPLLGADRAVRAGEWPVLRGRELGARTVGLLGLGRIGDLVARRCAAFGCEVLAHDPFLTATDCGARLVGLDELVTRAEVLSLHAPLTDTTRDLVDLTLLARLPEGAVLVNTARGELVDEEALLWALDRGPLAAAALDALREEPPPPGHPLLGRDDVLVTPHAAPHTAEATATMGRMAVDDLLAVLDGREPRHPVPLPEDHARL